MYDTSTSVSIPQPGMLDSTKRGLRFVGYVTFHGFFVTGRNTLQLAGLLKRQSRRLVISDAQQTFQQLLQEQASLRTDFGEFDAHTFVRFDASNYRLRGYSSARNLKRQFSICADGWGTGCANEDTGHAKRPNAGSLVFTASVPGHAHSFWHGNPFEAALPCRIL